MSKQEHARAGASTNRAALRLSGKTAWQQEGLTALPQGLGNERLKFMNYMNGELKFTAELWKQCSRGSNADSSSPLQPRLAGTPLAQTSGDSGSWGTAGCPQESSPFLTKQPSWQAETRAEKGTGSPLHKATPEQEHRSRGDTLGTVLLQQQSWGCHNSAVTGTDRAAICRAQGGTPCQSHSTSALAAVTQQQRQPGAPAAERRTGNSE